MSASVPSQAAMAIAILLMGAFLAVVDIPYILRVCLSLLFIAWGGWMVISTLRSRDELHAASTRFSLALAAGIGTPLSLILVMLMTFAPGARNAISDLASLGADGSDLAITGFGLGVTFTLFLQCSILLLGQALWWMSKR
ncbi:hypothetical protein [Pseudophaeobacter sp.]|uniref:hypothetical protein n=1 Tax=Pseudophaeobacter sp. TaxID=1971739 RepID=UPI0032968266